MAETSETIIEAAIILVAGLATVAHHIDKQDENNPKDFMTHFPHMLAITKDGYRRFLREDKKM